MLNIDLKENNKELLVILEGRLDTASAPEADALLQKSLPGAEALTIDMEKLEYISSAGLRVLLSAEKTLQKQGGRKLKLIHVNEIVMEIFEITGFSAILDIEPAENAAASAESGEFAP